MGNNQDPIYGSYCFLHHEVSDSMMVSVLFGHWDLGLAAFESGWVLLFCLIRRLCMAGAMILMVGTLSCSLRSLT